MEKSRQITITEALRGEGEVELGVNNTKLWVLSLVLLVTFTIASIALVVLVTLFHIQVIQIFQPFSDLIRDLPFGFLIPGVIVFACVFPPLFGHEIIAVLCGAVYGSWAGFSIVAVGIILGEVGTWLVFQRLLRSRSTRLEASSSNFCSLVQTMDQGSLLIVVIVRLSVIPAHFSTAILSACKVPFWQFTTAAMLTLPKQFALVYLGSLPMSPGAIEHESEAGNGPRRLDTRITIDNSILIQLGVVALAVLVSIGLAVHAWSEIRRFNGMILEEQQRRKVLMAVAPRGPLYRNNDHGHKLSDEHSKGSSTWGGSYLQRKDCNAARDSSTRATSSRGNSSDQSGGDGISIGSCLSITPSNDHASLISGVGLQDKSFHNEQDVHPLTRGRSRTRRTRGQSARSIELKKVEVVSLVLGGGADKQSKSHLGRSKSHTINLTNTNTSTSTSTKRKNRKTEFYLLAQSEHELSTFRAHLDNAKDKTSKTTRNYNYVIPPPTPPPALNFSSMLSLPPIPPLPPLPTPPPITAFQSSNSNSTGPTWPTTTTTPSSPYPRPTSASSMSVASFSRPRQPLRSRRTLSISSTSAGHVWHHRFLSEDTNLPLAPPPPADVAGGDDGVQAVGVAIGDTARPSFLPVSSLSSSSAAGMTSLHTTRMS